MANPEVLRRLDRGLLLQWLKPSERYLNECGLWVRAADPESLDLDRLGRVFMELRAGMPEELVQSLFLISEMATPAGLDDILAEAERRGLELGLGAKPTPADAAMRLWLKDPGLLESLHHCQEMGRPRAFQYFSTAPEAPPPFADPAPGQITALEERLSKFYLAWKRGPGTRVFVYRQPREWWFVVRHGAACRREPALEEGRPTSVFYRPQKHDVLVYDADRGEMRVHCCAARERRILLRHFGVCLFGDANHFPGTAKYTLAPLVRHGRDCLACRDVPGIERVSLVEVEFYFREEPWRRVIQRADDIFALVERGQMRWPDRTEAIARATFEFQFRRPRRPRRLTIIPCNKALYVRETDGALLERWMQARAFAAPAANPN